MTDDTMSSAAVADRVQGVQLENPGEAEDASNASLKASVKGETDKKKRKKKAKREFVPLPAVDALVASGAVPWNIAFTQRLGRHIIATRDIAAGELVLRERAVVALPRDRFAPRVCHACFKELPGAARGSPEDVSKRYCSEPCRTATAAMHERTAPVLPHLQGIAKECDCDVDLLRIMVELDAARSLAAGATGDEGVPAEQSSQAEAGDLEGRASDVQAEMPTLRCGIPEVDALQTHWERMPQSWRNSICKACRQLQEAIAATQAFGPGSPEQLQRMAAAVNSNAHGLGLGGNSGNNTDQGFGMFPALSLLNHSCLPTCCWSTNGVVMEVRAVVDMKKGEELTVQYINLLEPRAVRAHQLADTKFFSCACRRCSAPLATSPDRFLEVDLILSLSSEPACRDISRHISIRTAHDWMQGVRCEKASCDGVLLAATAPEPSSTNDTAAEQAMAWRCCSCDAERPARTPQATGCADVVQRASALWQSIMMLSQMGRWKEAKRQAEALLGSVGGHGQLHRLHIHAVDTYIPLLNCCRSQGDIKGSIDAIQHMIEAMDVLLAGTASPEQANFLKLLAGMQAERASEAPAALSKRMKQQAAATAERASRMQRICLGA